jgi:CelD/BcsL family acetyltransferase involved in cellulose biosynthesis
VSAAGLRVERIGHGDLVDERLALAESTRNVFATPEFHATWWRHCGGGRDMLLTAVLDGERLVGVLPVYSWLTRPVRAVRFIGRGGGDDLGPVALPEDVRRVAAVFRREFPETGLGHHVRPEWRQPLGARTLAREPSPVLATGEFAGWDDYLASRSANFRQTVRNRERRLQRGHDVSFRLATQETLDRDLDTLFRLHRSRWGDGPTTFGMFEPFHRDFAGLALERGWARLVVLELDGRAAAAWYGFRFAGVDAFYQSGRDPDLERQAVGLVLLAHTIRSSIEDGQEQYRFLRGGEAYKFRFTDDDSHVETIVMGRGAGALAAVGPMAIRARRRFVDAGRAARR